MAELQEPVGLTKSGTLQQSFQRSAITTNLVLNTWRDSDVLHPGLSCIGDLYDT
jgi:hypothetical protein